MTTAAVPVQPASATRAALFDCGRFDAFEDWRDMAWWPVSIDETARLQQDWMRMVLDFALNEQDEEIVDSVLLGFAGLAPRSLPIAEAALVLQRARDMGAVLAGVPDEVSWLDGASNAATPPIDSIPHMPELIAARHPLAKRLVLTARWNRPWQVPGALLSPDATVMVANQFLNDEARQSSLVLSYRDAGALVQATRARAGRPAATFDVAAVAQRFVSKALEICPVSGDIRERLSRVLFAKVDAVLRICGADIAAIRHVERLPEAIWGGTGNAYALRVIALEVLRRGGKVTLFDHGGTTAMLRAADAFATRELAVCTEYVMPSPGLAKLQELQESVERVRPLRSSRVAGGRGEKHLLQLPLRKSRSVRARPRVVYVTAVTRGLHRTGAVPLPDSVYVEWQLRVAEALLQMPVDLVCKPHPAGAFSGRRHPLESVAPTTYVPFEETMPDADVFVFDRCASTTFWESVCTDRPIVYLDMQMLSLAKEVRPMFDRRCRSVPVHFDALNRPQFDADAFREAVLGATEAADPTEFQQLLIDEIA